MGTILMPLFAHYRPAAPPVQAAYAEGLRSIMDALLCLHTHRRVGRPIVARMGHIRHSPPLPVKAGWRGAKPSLDALIYVAAAGSVIKAGASQPPMRIVRLAALIAPADATGGQPPPGYSYGRGLDRQPLWRQCNP